MRLLLTVLCVFALTTSARANTPSPKRIEELRLAASRLLSTYGSEVQKPAWQQSVVMLQDIKG
jgi:hypothetical protein